MRSTSEKVLNRAANQRCTRSATHQNHFIDFLGLQFGIGKRQFDWTHGAIDNRADQSVENAAGKFLPEHFSIGQRKFKRCRFLFGKFVLDRNQRFAQFLRDFAMWREIDLIRLQNLFVHESLQEIVDIVATQVRIAIGGKHLIDVAFVRGN